MVAETGLAGMRQPGKERNSKRREQLNCTGRRLRPAVLFFALAGLLLPVSGKGQVSSEPFSQHPAAVSPATPESREQKLRLLEQSHAALKKDYANRTAELVETLDRLAESMARLGAMQGWNEEKKKLLADNKALRDLAGAREGQFNGAESLRRRLENDYLALRVEYEERRALLSVAARDLNACDDDRVALRKDLDRRTIGARDLEAAVLGLKTKLSDLEATSVQSPPGNGVLLASLEKEIKEQRKSVATQGEEVARLKKELDKAQGQAREKQGALDALRDEKEKQAGITKQLARKVQETTSRLIALQSQIAAVESELKSLKD